MKADKLPLNPAQLLQEYAHLLRNENLPGPILDLAAGECHNANFMAQEGLQVIACDKSAEALERGEKLAAQLGVTIETWLVDLERESVNPLPEDFYGGILVFRYLHRPLIPHIRRALKKRGILIYETFTVDQPRFGKPHNPDYLLRPNELRNWFTDWKIIHYFEGVRHDPKRSVAQIVCQKGVLNKDKKRGARRSMGREPGPGGGGNDDKGYSELIVKSWVSTRSPFRRIRTVHWPSFRYL